MNLIDNIALFVVSVGAAAFTSRAVDKQRYGQAAFVALFTVLAFLLRIALHVEVVVK